MRRKKAVRIYLLVNATLFVLAFLFLFLDSYDLFDGFATCQWLKVGLYCPTCGMTRAAHALLRLRLGAAFTLNPMIFPLLAVVAYYEISLLKYARKIEEENAKKPRLWPFVALVVALAAFCVLRNLLLLAGIDPIGDLLHG